MSTQQQSTAYYVGDTPAAPLSLVPVRDGEPIDLGGYATASASLLLPTGGSVAAVAVLTSATDTSATDTSATDTSDADLSVQLPQLTVAGLSWLQVTLATTDARTDRLDPVPIIVQDFDGWHTLGSARAEWRDAQDLSDRRLYTLLQVAKADCVAYAPALPDGTLPPIHYREAQLLQARNMLNAGRVDPASGDNGGQGFALSAFPLDWAVKQILRPQRGLRRVR